MIKIEIENLIKKIIGKETIVEMPENFNYGDFSTSIAIKEKLNPQEIADKLKISSLFEKVEVVNGFVNFFLKPEFFLDNLRKILKQKDKYGSLEIGKGKTIVIDYSGPNIAKPFGIGHLRSTIIGQAVYNLYEFSGYKTIGDNHLGDWGTQFGKLIYQIQSKNLNAKKLNIEELEKIYVEFHQQAKENPKLDDEARRWFLKLEKGDKKAKEIWQACKEISLKEFDRIYNLLGVKIDNVLGESFYQDKMQEVFEEMKKKKLTRQNEGAWVVEFENNILPSLVLVKSDGATTYFLRDLTTVKYRLKKWNPDIIAYEVGADQCLYFKQLFKTVQMLGWFDDVRLEHIGHGLMRSKTGKFSTRQGDTIHLEEVLQEAVDKAKEIINNSETDKGLNEKEKNDLANKVGIGAVKYNDLSQHHSKDIVFDWDKVLNLKGNSGPYLQYVFARTESILKKTGGSGFGADIGSMDFGELTETEKTLLKKLSRFQIVVEQATVNFSPNLICNYAFDLSQTFNLFYDQTPILKAATKEQKDFRLALTFGVRQVIKNSLTILGIEAPERM